MHSQIQSQAIYFDAPKVLSLCFRLCMLMIMSELIHFPLAPQPLVEIASYTRIEVYS